MTSYWGAMSANERDAITAVMAGLDPAIHQSSQRLLLEEDGLPGQARQRRFDGRRAQARRDRDAVSGKLPTQSMIH
jgi:hypothetical protein